MGVTQGGAGQKGLGFRMYPIFLEDLGFPAGAFPGFGVWGSGFKVAGSGSDFWFRYSVVPALSRGPWDSGRGASSPPGPSPWLDPYPNTPPKCAVQHCARVLNARRGTDYNPWCC